MFGKKSIIICVVTPERNLDAHFVVETGKGLRVEKTVSAISFQTVKQTYHGSHVRLLVSEDDVYLKLLRFPKGTIITRDMVFEKIREIIPEDITDAFFDWKEVPIGNDELGVQVFAVKQSVLAPLAKTAAISGVTIDAVESPSLAVARLTSHIKESFLLVYPPAKPQYLAAVSGGRVLEVVSVDELTSLEDAKHTFVAYVKKIWGVTVTAIANDMPNPIIGLAAKQDFQGEDMDVLTIPSTTTATHPRTIPIVLIIFGAALLVFGIAFFVIRFMGTKPTSATPKQEIDVTIPVSPTIHETETLINKAELKVEVQNGTGEVGLAGKGKKVLEDAGYTNVTTANADLFDYEGVMVKGKTIEIAQFVVVDLKTAYSQASVSSTIIDNNATVDAIVILGKE